MAQVRVARVYDARTDQDGRDVRVLVDRLWPRGLRKDDADLDEWCKAVAPSPELRRWYGHDPERFEEFARRYRDELDAGEQAEQVERLRELASERPLTLLTATRDLAISHAEVLAERLRS